MAPEPMFWIHLNIDYPFNLTGVLYFPKLGNAMEVTRNKIHLYSNQVYVTDDVRDIVPEWLLLLHGVIDSPDIPLNVSRSYLQSDANVKKISEYITKKVADKLHELFKNDRPAFEQKWRDLGVFVKYGMISDKKFEERAMNFTLVENTARIRALLNDYKEKIKANQTDKHGKTVVDLHQRPRRARRPDQSSPTARLRCAAPGYRARQPLDAAPGIPLESGLRVCTGRFRYTPTTWCKKMKNASQCFRKKSRKK
jgi:HSP90 family molecular chaperone